MPTSVREVVSSVSFGKEHTRVVHTLILDQGYAPQRIVPWQRAVSLLFGDKAEVVEDYDELISSVSLSMPMPAVVRLRRVARRVSNVRFCRAHVLLRDRSRCQYCGVVQRACELTFDHVLPRSRGGATSWENIVMACRNCNAFKRDRTPHEAGMRLLKRPGRPSWLPPLATLQLRNVPASWQAFLRTA